MQRSLQIVEGPNRSEREVPALDRPHRRIPMPQMVVRWQTNSTLVQLWLTRSLAASAARSSSAIPPR